MINLKIGTKLGSAFGFLLVMMVVMVCVGINSTRRINGSVKEIAKGSYVKSGYAYQASKALDDVVASIRMLALVKDEKTIATQKQKIEEARGRYREAMAKLEEMEKSEQGVKLLANMKDAIAPAAQANNRVMGLALAHKQDEAVALLLREAIPLTQKVSEAFDAQVKFQQGNVDATYQKSEKIYGQTKWFQIIAGMIAIILGILAATFLTHHFTFRIKKLAVSMVQIADGDLSAQVVIHADDEIGELGRSINRMVTSVGSIMASVKRLHPRLNHRPIR